MSARTTTFTDDLTICVARGETLASLVDYVIESERGGAPWVERLDVLTERFALSFDDARLAIDRVGGGRVRAANPANEPDPARDPVAWIAYRRARGEPVSVGATGPTPEEEREATALWRHACEGAGAARATTSVAVALRLHELTAAMMAEAGDAAREERVLLQAATALSTAAEACIDTLGDWPCAPEGTHAWADGVRLAECSRRLAGFFAALGSPAMERRALDLRGRIVTRMLGQSHARVGRAMLDSARCALGMDDRAHAASLCEAVVTDFARLVDEWEPAPEAPFDEHRMALEHLLAALDLLASINQAAADSGSGRVGAGAPDLRARCAAVLAR
jgi:hypothetical protein